MISILTIIFFVLGTIIGSFLNVVILRMNTAKSFGGRSSCMTCGHSLSWYELIPVFSYLALGGRCLKCKTHISLQYPVVELTSGVLFAALFLKFQNVFFGSTLNFSFTYAYYAAVFSILLVIVVYDIRHKIIPDSLSLILGILTFAGLFFFSTNGYIGFYFHTPSILELLSGVLVAIPFALLWLVSRGKWMGLGDAKLAIGLGWLLGPTLALSGIVLSFWIGALIGIFLLIFSKKYGFRSEIPFAPYLVIGTLLVFLFEFNIVSYLSN